MDAICWIPILIVAYLVIRSILEVWWEDWQGDKWREKTGRENKNDFRVKILGKKTYKGWITIGEHLGISGGWGHRSMILSLLNMEDHFSEVASYNEVKKIALDHDDMTNDVNRLLRIDIEKSSSKKTIYLSVSNPDDVKLIEESISQKIYEFNRKIELERIMRARYRTGNFKDISPNNFEKVIQELFTFMGYSVVRVGGSGDGGVDLRCQNNSTGEKVIVQCKRYTGKVGIGIVRDFYGTLVHNKSNKGYIVITSEFTKEAQSWIHDKPIELIDSRRLSQLMLKHYR